MSSCITSIAITSTIEIQHHRTIDQTDASRDDRMFVFDQIETSFVSLREIIQKMMIHLFGDRGHAFVMHCLLPYCPEVRNILITCLWLEVILLSKSLFDMIATACRKSSLYLLSSLATIDRHICHRHIFSDSDYQTKTILEHLFEKNPTRFDVFTKFFVFEFMTMILTQLIYETYLHKHITIIRCEVTTKFGKFSYNIIWIMEKRLDSDSQNLMPLDTQRSDLFFFDHTKILLTQKISMKSRFAIDMSLDILSDV